MNVRCVDHDRDDDALLRALREGDERNDDVHRNVPVSNGVRPEFQGVSDTVLTQYFVRLSRAPDRPCAVASLRRVS
jgi:hypothetical protein